MTLDKKNKVVVTTGTSFSGSTILSLLLDSHPDVIALGDGLNPQILSKRVENFFCSCGERIGNCAFWTDVEKRMQRVDAAFSLRNCNMRFSRLRPNWDRILGRYYDDRPRKILRRLAERFSPAYQQHVRRHVARNIDFCQAVLESSGKSVYVHNAKPLLMLNYLWNAPELDAKVLHIVRDPRGFVASASKRDFTVAQAAERWVRYHQNVLDILEPCSRERILMIPYEHICNDTQELLDKIFAFFGLERHAVSRTIIPPNHHVLGNDLRLEKCFDLEMDLSWKAKLSPKDTAKVRNVCERTYELLGFAWD